jgi:hypothetical protein
VENTKGQGVAIVTGTFDQARILSYIRSRTTPTELEYGGARVIMIPEQKSDQIDNGIAFLSDREIAVGNLDSIKRVLDTREGSQKSMLSDPGMSSLISSINPEEMFWFAGDATVLAKAPLTTPLMPNMSAIQNIFGTLNLGDPIMGKISVTAKDATSATQLVDFTKGLVALGSLAGAQNPDIAALAGGIQIAQSSNQFDISIRIPFQLLVKLDAAKTNILK